MSGARDERIRRKQKAFFVAQARAFTIAAILDGRTRSRRWLPKRPSSLSEVICRSPRKLTRKEKKQESRVNTRSTRASVLI